MSGSLLRVMYVSSISTPFHIPDAVTPIFLIVCVYIYIFCFTSIYFNLQPDILVHNFFTHAGCPGGNVPDFRENVPYVKVHRYNPKHLYPKLNGYGNNGERSLKV